MSETTEVKGQFGLGQSGGTGKKLKIYSFTDMSRYQPTKQNCKQSNINWINTLVHVHDLQCNCDSPLEHTTLQIFNQEKNLRFTTTEISTIQKCLTTGEEDTPEEENFGPGDLEALFADDFGEGEKDTATG